MQIRDYSIELAQIASGIITDVMGQGLTAKTSYTPDGNSIVIEFNGYPVYGSRKPGKVYVLFPRSTFCVRQGKVKFNEIYQAQCRYYQNRLGEQFAHPHVYNDGHPCWHDGKREHAVDFISNIIETLLMENVTKDSVTIGLCASGIMGVGNNALQNAHIQKNRVVEKLKSMPIAQDHRKLESYVNKRWCSKITILINSI